MADVSKAAKVGAMTLLLSGALVFGYRFVSRETGADGGYQVWAYIPDATGIAPKSRVTISGIQVGYLDRIQLEDGKAKVTVQMFPQYELHEDAAIGKRASSLIGESFIVLTPGTEGKPLLDDNDQITRYIEEADVQSLQQQIKVILDDIKKVTESLATSVGGDRGQEQIATILKNLAETTEQLNATVKENRAGLRDAIDNVNAITGQARPEVSEILRNVREMTANVRAFTAGAEPGTDAKPGEIKTTLERIDRASASLESALKHADNVAARVDRGEGTVGRLTRDEALINEIEATVEDVGSLIGGIGRLQTVVGLRSDYNFLANTIKSYVELRLQPAEDKYYLIEIVNDPRGLTRVEQIDVDTTNPNQPPHYREVRQTTENAFRFSFQFAKRIGPFTGRFGIKESTGGIGLDLHLLDDRFELQQDFFGFGESLNPRWRVALAYEFIRKLWLLGGVDHILSDDRRDYFIGLQLRFNDQDLKTILPFAPSVP